MIEKNILEHLKAYKKRKIKLIEIEKNLPANLLYKDYANIILNLINDGYLKMVKASGFNHKTINLPNEFYIESKKISSEYYIELEKYALKYSGYFKLDYYFNQSEKKWLQDKEYISKIYDFLKINGFPKLPLTSQELSYDIVADEKWLDYKGGMKILVALNIKEKLNIKSQNEPAMFAINLNFEKNGVYKHLIVENKAVYYRLLDLLDATSFSTLIYGAGWRVISMIKDFNKQFPFKGEHNFYYFGDIDYEGIKIFKSINEILKVNLATSFYIKLLEEKESIGKQNQLKNQEAFDFFKSNFLSLSLLERVDLLDQGYYWPQEGLSKIYLKEMWEKLDAD
ncbi:Wadjet anti-phage system protein JetD domain-containing protein [Helicovermis profundi]|uniref:DUF2220 family protein n=1 Tax=Helicovermis profundi TaxID=3065157 RepID=A0AAU9EFL6_9FIRM|nr:DUF2220 family protein [Clostridia bacterium S502]